MNGLFRGKRVDNGDWIEGYYAYIKSDNRHVIITQDEVTEYGGLLYRTVIPETVGQYTGMDINNVKVFIGDIIDVFPSKRKMFVLWNEETLSWEIADIGTHPGEINHLINCMPLGELCVEACFENKVKSKVVGNIYDNTEMMETNDVEISNQTF